VGVSCIAESLSLQTIHGCCVCRCTKAWTSLCRSSMSRGAVCHAPECGPSAVSREAPPTDTRGSCVSMCKSLLLQILEGLVYTKAWTSLCRGSRSKGAVCHAPQCGPSAASRDYPRHPLAGWRHCTTTTHSLNYTPSK
jgi:hypothetical protein